MFLIVQPGPSTIVKPPQTLGVEGAQNRLPEAALYAAAQKLLGAPDSVRRRRSLVRIYAELGLLEPAQELINFQPSGLLDDSSPDCALTRLAEMQTTRLAWSTYRNRYVRNLDCLSERHPDICEWLQPWNQQSADFELYRLRDGNFQVAQKNADRSRTWWPALADHRGEQLGRAFAHDQKSLMPAPYLFHGLGYGWFVRRVHECTRKTFLEFSPAIYVVESDPIGLAIALHLHDWREFLSDDRVYIFFGANGLRMLERFWLSEDGLPLAGTCVHNSLTPASHSRDVVAAARRAVDRRQRLLQRAVKTTASRYADKGADYWAERFGAALAGRSDPLRIVIPVSRQTTYLQYSVRDTAEALRAQGHECQVLMERSNHHIVSMRDFLKALHDGAADLLLAMDHLRAGSFRTVPINLPMLTWDQDVLPHAINRRHISGMGPFDVIAGCSPMYYAHHLGCDPDRVCPSIIPTSNRTYHDEPVHPDDFRRYQCDIAYVSHASQTPEEFHQEERARLGDERGRLLLDKMYRLAIDAARQGQSVHGGAGHWILEAATAATGIGVKHPTLRERLLNWYLWRLTDRIFRHEALEWVGRWALASGRSFYLYGRGWERHPTLGQFARGAAQNGYELRCIYQASSINLQLMPAGFLHQRALDGLASGGFFLTRYTYADHLTLLAARIVKERDRLISRSRGLTEDPGELKQLLEDYATASGVTYDPANNTDLMYFQCTASQEAGTAVFPMLPRIEFYDEASLIGKVETYIGDPGLRAGEADAMRRIVLERFTYERTVEKFLTFVRDFLKSRAGETCKWKNRVAAAT